MAMPARTKTMPNFASARILTSEDSCRTSGRSSSSRSGGVLFSAMFQCPFQVGILHGQERPARQLPQKNGQPDAEQAKRGSEIHPAYAELPLAETGSYIPE